MISLTYFTCQTNLSCNQTKITSVLSPPAEFYNHFHITITLVVIVDLIYLHPKTFSLLSFVKLLFSYNVEVLGYFIKVEGKRN